MLNFYKIAIILFYCTEYVKKKNRREISGVKKAFNVLWSILGMDGSPGDISEELVT